MQSGHRKWRSVVRVLIILLLAAGAVGMIRLRPWLFPDPAARAESAYQDGDYERADRLSAERLKTAPNDHRALRVRARVAARLGRDRVARTLYGRIGGPQELEAEDYWLLGRIIDRLGSRETARTCWIDGLRADPDHPGLLKEIVDDLIATGKPIQAARFARRLAAQPGERARGRLLLAKALDIDNDPQGALDARQNALDADPNLARTSPEIPHAIARDALRLGESARARESLEAHSQEPDDETCWLLARSYLQERSKPEVERWMVKGSRYREEHPLEPEPSPYVGSTRCRECHETVSDAVLHSRHSRTFRRSPEISVPTTDDHPIADPGLPDVQHTLRHDSDGLHYETRAKERVQAAVLTYAFGSGDRGVTLVGHDDQGRVRELRLSLYEGGKTWDVTTGQTTPPGIACDALGKVLTEDELRACFYCHATVPRSARDQTGPESSDPAIGCERCHGPGGNHLDALAIGLDDPAIARPGAGSGPEVVTLCGTCHSPLGLTIKPSDQLAPRFPAAGLTWSRCYTESGAAIDCLTCHDPHHDAETTPAFYNGKCLACHSASNPQSSAAIATPSSFGSTCPVEPSGNCIDCHMPRTDQLISHTRFTDHYIRIHPRKKTQSL